MASNLFHRGLERHGLGIELSRRVRPASEHANHVDGGIARVGEDKDVGDRVLAKFVLGRGGRQQGRQLVGEPGVSEPLQKTDDLAIGRL